MNLCPACSADDAAWRDARPFQGGIRIHTVGKPLNRLERAERHYALVRQQRDLIRRICAEKHQEPVQLPLWEVA